MNGKDQRRALILTAVVEGRLAAGEAAELMSLSGRHERRLRHALLRDGPAALVHGNRGRKPVHTLGPGLRERVTALAEGLYSGCNDQHLTTLEEANAALPALLARHNARFRQAPAQAGSAYRHFPAGTRPNDVFCFRYWRTVSLDNVVSLDGRIITIPPGPQRRSYARAKVEVREHLDGSASVHYQGACIARQRAMPGHLRTKRRGAPAENAAPPTAFTKTPKPARTAPWKPAANHPWRRSLVTA